MSASISARLTSALTAVACCSCPIAQAGKRPATTWSTITSANQAGTTQTGSQPMSRMRIDCSVKLATPKKTIAAIIAQLLVRSSGRIAGRCIAQHGHCDCKADRRHHDRKRDRGEEEMQSPEPGVQAEDETEHWRTLLAPYAQK